MGTPGKAAVNHPGIIMEDRLDQSQPWDVLVENIAGYIFWYAVHKPQETVTLLCLLLYKIPAGVLHFAETGEWQQKSET